MSHGLQPRPHQLQALTDLMAAFAVHDRAQLVMACGTGKTLVGRWHAEASGATNVLVLVPSLSLLTQTLAEWRRLHSWPFDALVVCSDPTTSTGAAERREEDGSTAVIPDWSTVRAKVTTNAQVASGFLTRRGERARVVFSTYHSAPVVAAAQASSKVVFDLAICDEAHRLAGAPREEFRVALNPRQVVARRRLFMTATPRMSTVEGGTSMDDPTVFGPVAHTVSFGDAIQAGLLCDYQVLVLGAGPGSVDDPLAAVPTALLDAVDRHQVRKVLTFHSRVARAAAFAHTVDQVKTPSGHTVRARHLSGAMPAEHRARMLSWLAQDTDGDEVRLISNARILSEGVDVPAVDAVCFADTRSSVVDILQAVGRVLRPHPGKRIGSIIVPIGLPEDGDDDTELLVSRFSLLWSVLRALRSHDERFAREVDRAVHGVTRHGGRGCRPARVEYQLPDWLDEDLVHLRMVQQVGDAWEKHHAATLSWAYANPGRRLPRMTRHLDLGIGEWAVKQRQAHASGVLPVDRAEQLEKVPEWYWDRGDAAWEDTWSILLAFAEAHGTLAENQTDASIFAGMRAAHPQREQLDVWVATQRQAYRAATLDPRRAALLERLPGWTWTPLPAEELAMVDALAQFVEFEKHARVPDQHVEGGLPLGRWVWSVRRRKLTGTLHPALEAEIWAATPSRWRTGVRTRWQWEKPETQWRLAYTALRAFTEREGQAAPPTTHRELLPDAPVRVGQWVALQRHQHRTGELDPRRAAALERLPGWRWEGDVGGTRRAEEPIELPAHLAHGTAGALDRGCKCAGCLEYRRGNERAWLQRRRDARLASGVDAAAVRRHLAQVETELVAVLAEGDSTRRRAGIGRSLIARTAGVPLAVVREVCTGQVTKVTPTHRTRLLAVTVQMCLTNVSAAGSRGRLVQAGAERVDAGPTVRLLTDLEIRGFNRGWIGRELGYTRGLQLTGDRCTAATATAVRNLHQAVGDLVAPPTPRNQMIPSLSQLRKNQDTAA